MSIQSEIERITANIASTYSALSARGATMPAAQNSDNLAETVNTVTGGEGGGTAATKVQPDWNQTDETAEDFIKNKPFGLEYGMDTLVWDGITEGHVTFTGADTTVCKVSDATPALEELNQGGHIMTSVETVEWAPGELTAEDNVSPGGIIAVFPFFLVVPADRAGVFDEDFDMTFPEAGVYFLDTPMDNGYAVKTCGLQVNGYQGFAATKKIEQTYLNGAVILFVGDSGYLYEAVGLAAPEFDVSNRLTKARLNDLFWSGRSIYLTTAASALAGVYCPMARIQFCGTYAIVIAISLSTETPLAGTTAEYSQQTQEVTE